MKEEITLSGIETEEDARKNLIGEGQWFPIDDTVTDGLMNCPECEEKMKTLIIQKIYRDEETFMPLNFMFGYCENCEQAYAFKQDRKEEKENG